MVGLPDKYVGHAGHVKGVSFSVCEYHVLVVLMYYLMGIQSLTHPSIQHPPSLSLSLSHTHTHTHTQIYIYAHVWHSHTVISNSVKLKSQSVTHFKINTASY